MAAHASRPPHQRRSRDARVGAAAQHVDRAAASSRWTPREVELLTVTLQLLRQHGYDRLTVDAVAAAARASKATMYRRWPTKAELVLAAFVEGLRSSAVPPDSGDLRRDLLLLGTVVRKHARAHAATIRAVLVEVSRNTALNDALRQRFLDQYRHFIQHILHAAADRGEVDSAGIDVQLLDLLPGYVMYRSIIVGVPPTDRMVQALVDNIIIPSLT